MKFLKNIFGRFAINAIFILSQIFLFIFYINKISKEHIYIYTALVFLSYLLIIFIVNKKTNNDHKIPWIVFILLFPIPGVISYFLFGQRFISKNFRKKITNEFHNIHKQLDIKLDEDLDIIPKVKNQLYYIEKTASTKPSSNTQTEYFKTGHEMFLDMLETLKLAKNYIFMEYFIIHEGYMWNSILNILKEKVKEGVDIRIMYDDIGSVKNLPKKFKKRMRELGIKVETFNRFVPIASSVHNFRDHRKFMIIDGIYGYTGGVNISDEYIGYEKPYNDFKDTGIKLTGNAVKNMVVLFLSLWNVYDKNKTNDYSKYLESTKEVEPDGIVHLYGDGPAPIYEHSIGEDVYVDIINQAEKYLYITTPYLIINERITFSLKYAAMRGVDVRIITPGEPDKKTIYLLTRDSYEELIEAGVKIYEYTPGFIHQKVFLADDEIGVVGTINLDYRSLVHHFECASYLYKSKCLKDIKEDFYEMFDVSRLVPLKEAQKKGTIKRIILSILKFFSPLL